MIRFRGEEMWVGDDHVADMLPSRGERPLAVYSRDGDKVYDALNRRAAELWVNVHIGQLLDRADRRR